MNVLVIGGTGYLGGHVVRELTELPDVRVFAGVRDRGRANFGESVTVVDADPFAVEALRALTATMDAVIFTAGKTWTPGSPIAEYTEKNVELTQRFFAAIRGHQNLRVVFTSSLVTVGGTVARLVLNEKSGRQNVCENRLNPYDRAKIECEQIALDYAREGRNVVILNPGLLIGPPSLYGGNPPPPYLSTWVLTGKCPFIIDAAISVADVRDAARAHATAVLQGKRAERYILGGHNLLKSELNDHLSELTGVAAPRRIPGAALNGLACFLDAASALTGGKIKSPLHRHFARSQSLHYCGDSSQAMKDLDFRIRPIRESLMDMLIDDVKSGRLPHRFKYLETITTSTAREYLLLRQLARTHYCAKFLLPQLSKLLATCRLNHDLRDAFHGLLEASIYNPRDATFRWRDRNLYRSKSSLIHQLFEFAYFTSNEFLNGVL